MVADHGCTRHFQQPLGRSLLLGVLSQRCPSIISSSLRALVSSHRPATSPGNRCFSSPNAHIYNPESFLQCRLWPISSEWGTGFCISNRAPEDAEGDDPGPTFWVARWWVWMISICQSFDGSPPLNAASMSQFQKLRLRLSWVDAPQDWWPSLESH